MVRKQVTFQDRKKENALKISRQRNVILSNILTLLNIKLLQANSLHRAACRGGDYFPYILLNEIQTMFSQLSKRSARVLPADLCTDLAHYVKNHRSTVLRRNKNMAVEGGTVSHYYLVIRKFIDFFRHSVIITFILRG